MRCLNCHQDGLSVSIEVCPQCGAIVRSLLRDVLPIGTMLRGGSYRLDYALGRGGFGITYRAIHTALEQPVAIKEFYPQEQALRDGSTGGLSILTTHQGAYQRGLERFVREGRILARLNHPNVVRVQDLFEERNTAYLVMELLVGRTLQQELEAQSERRLLPERVTEIIEPLVRALEQVHQAGIYHLDLKPDNVMLTTEGRVVLVDFGAARQGFSSRSTQAYTLEYAAPEVIAGKDVGPQSDIFELGMMLYEMLTGERPASALNRLLKDTWEPRKLEEPWQSSISTALRIPKEERPPSVKEWWEAATAKSRIREDAAKVVLDREDTINLSLFEAFHGVEKRLRLGDEEFSVRIPPGVQPDRKLTVRGKGLLDSATGKRGNLYLKVGILPDSFFQFEGENLVCEVQITATQARTGTSIEVATLEGSVSVRVPPGVRSGQLLRLRGKGWLRSGGGRGDQLVRVAIASSEGSDREIPTLAPIVVSQWGDGDYHTINEAIQNAPPGSRILVRPGHYHEGLAIDKPLAILGDGPIADIIVESTDSDCILMATDSALVRGLTLRGRGSLVGNKFFAVDIPQGQLVLEDCDITSDSLPCVGIHGFTSNPIIRRCQIHDSESVGVFVYEEGQGTVEDCNIFGHLQAGVAIVQESKPVIRKCRIHSGQAEGIWVNQALGIVEDCDIFGNAKAGVEIKEDSNPVIRKCKIHAQSTAAIVIHSNGQGTVEGCDIFANPDVGILILDGGNPTIRQCQIRDGESAGILILENGQGTVEDCHIFGNKESGVVIGGGSNPVIRLCRIYNGKGGGVLVGENGRGIVENCDIFGNANPGISIYEGGNPLIQGCQIHHGQEGGVFIHSNGEGTLEDCDIFSNPKAGVEIREGSTPVLRKCQIHDNQASGVIVWGNAQGLVETCDIFGNTYSGVLIRENGNPTIRKCKINRNGYEAVWVCNDGAGTVENCDLANNARGAWDIEDGCWVQRSGNKE